MATKSSTGVDWRRRILTLVVGVPTALRLLVWDLGMLLLVALVCALCLLEFGDNLCAQIVPGRHGLATRLSHRVLMVAAGVFVCLAAWGGNKDVHGKVTCWARPVRVAAYTNSQSIRMRCAVALAAADAAMALATLVVILYHLLHTNKLDQQGASHLY